jgi:hypothetical protein
MSMAAEIVTWIVALVICAANLLFWAWGVRGGEGRFKSYVESHFGVRIERGHRGHWRVVSGGSWGKRLLLELLQLAYFVGLMLVWAVGMGVGVGVLALVQRVL